jgi:hypothetical protein
VVYGVTTQPDELFAFSPEGEVRDLGPAGGYTTSLALDPDGPRFFYMPGAYGDAWKHGTPLVEFDAATGTRRVVVELNPLAEQRLGLTAGGSYDVAVDPSGERVYVGLNAGPDHQHTFGKVVLMVVDLK